MPLKCLDRPSGLGRRPPTFGSRPKSLFCSPCPAWLPGPSSANLGRAWLRRQQSARSSFISILRKAGSLRASESTMTTTSIDTQPWTSWNPKISQRSGGTGTCSGSCMCPGDTDPFGYALTIAMDTEEMNDDIDIDPEVGKPRDRPSTVCSWLLATHADWVFSGDLMVEADKQAEL
mmetsp:Transcript_92203/g.192795  ORF Transcript_92203/g.192795 Transcript_92203/m.192795 type:complete len:176 (+) Transcript_92203:1621-2148(+)